MSALVRKETRLLLPGWLAALAAATSGLLPWRPLEGLLSFLCVATVLVLVLSPFGKETSYGTFGLLLVQPRERIRVWRTKTRLLAVALASVWVVFLVCSWQNVSGDDWGELAVTSGLFVLLAFSGGLWTTLLLRDTVSALFCTCVAPMILAGVTAGAIHHWVPDDSFTFAAIIYGILTVYGVAGYFWARRLFLGAEDVGWTGGQISLRPGRGMALRWLAFECQPGDSRWLALVKKELQLQEITMVLVPLFIVLHLCAVALNHVAPNALPKEAASVVMPLIWMAAVPWVIGCVAVSEERRLNTLEGLLCLPVRKSASFAVKFAVSMALGIVLGGLIPWLILCVTSKEGAQNLPLWAALGVAACITALGFHSSTMSRGLLQALPTTLGVMFLLTLAATLWDSHANNSGSRNFPISNSALLPTMALPAAVVTLLWLSFRNYRRLHVGAGIWIENLVRIAAVAAAVIVVAVGIFNRDWQLFMPLEPHHGAARINGPGRARMAVWHTGVAVLLPDGRLWVGNTDWRQKKISGGFVEGSNWLKIAARTQQAAAIKSDGTLWSISNRSTITQIGSASDWREITGSPAVFLAIKEDGTLWGWGYDDRGLLSEKSEDVSHGHIWAEPRRVQEGSDWVNVFIFDYMHAVGIKRDGSSWQWGYFGYSPNGGARRGNLPLHTPVRFNMDGTDWTALAGEGRLTLGLRADGSLWATGLIGQELFDTDMPEGLHPDVIRVGTKSDWIELGGFWHFTALEKNGELWSMENARTKRPSRYFDWLAAAEYGDMTWALAGDGTVSGWMEFRINEPDGPNPPTFWQKLFLGPDRRPYFSFNIFD